MRVSFGVGTQLRRRPNAGARGGVLASQGEGRVTPGYTKYMEKRSFSHMPNSTSAMVTNVLTCVTMPLSNKTSIAGPELGGPK